MAVVNLSPICGLETKDGFARDLISSAGATGGQSYKAAKDYVRLRSMTVLIPLNMINQSMTWKGQGDETTGLQIRPA